MTPQEAALIESYLGRSSLDYALRRRIEQEVFNKVRDKITIPPENTLLAESLLEALSMERRATRNF